MNTRHNTVGLAVLGMHRSGTSCLTGMLQFAGFHAGLVDEWNPDNLKGNRENQSILKLNEGVLSESGGAWDNPPLDISPLAEHGETRNRILRKLAKKGSPWLFKDPRVLITLPFWLDANSEFKMIGVVRHPVAVAKSLYARDRLPIVDGLRLWHKYNSCLFDAVLKHKTPLLYFTGEPDAFLAAVKTALTRLFPDEVNANVLEMDKMRSFFAEELLHHGSNPGISLQQQLAMAGLDDDEAQSVNSLWEDLLNVTINPPLVNKHRTNIDIAGISQPDDIKPADEDKPLGGRDFTSSLKALNAEISKSKSHVALWRQGVELFYKHEKKEGLSKWIKTMLKSYPDEPFLLFELARLEWSSGNRNEAIAAAEQCHQLASGWLPPLKFLAGWYSKSRRWEDAAKTLAQIVKYEGAGQGSHKAFHTQLYFDLGKGFNENQSIRHDLIMTDKIIRTSFDVSQFDPVSRLRLDPVNEPCVIKVISTVITDEDGISLNIVPSRSSAKFEYDSTFYFDNGDPQLYFESISNLPGKLSQVETSFKLLHSGSDALRACIEALSSAREKTHDTDKGGKLFDQDGNELPCFILDWQIDELNSAGELPGTVNLTGYFEITANHPLKLAINYSGATRIYPLEPESARPGHKESAHSGRHIVLRFCRSVPSNCIIRLGFEHDMNLSWLTSVKT